MEISKTSHLAGSREERQIKAVSFILGAGIQPKAVVREEIPGTGARLFVDNGEVEWELQSDLDGKEIAKALDVPYLSRQKMIVAWAGGGIEGGEEHSSENPGRGAEGLEERDINEIARRTADQVVALVRGTIPELAIHVAEHEVRGGGMVLDETRAKGTPCQCFEHKDNTFCWSPGVLGLISSKKNPEQLRDFCALGKEPAGEGAVKRFREISGAISEAHQEWEKEGGGLPEWWETVGRKFAEKGVEL